MEKCERPLNSVRPAPTGEDSDPTVSDSTLKSTNFAESNRKGLAKQTYQGPSCSNYDIDKDIMARLGFEPEGSATKPSYCEECLSLQGLLSDRTGYKVFYEYLQQQKHESLLDFWRSCEEFRRLAQTGSNLASRSANTTYKNYMHKKQLCGEILQDAIRAKVKHKLSSGQPPSESTFDNAQESILSYINETHYPNFVRSEVYKRHIGAESGKSSSKDRRNTGRFVGPALEPLPEEKVLAFDGEQPHGQWMCYDTSRSQSRSMDGEREGYLLQSLSKAELAGMYTRPAPVVSMNDSDVQSLSSDALTDDSKSTVTDFSDLTSKSTEKRCAGQHAHDIKGFLPRTKRLPKGRKQPPPEEFAKVLCEKLEKVLLQREQEERASINLGSLSREQSRENKKSILEDAAERHHQYQQAGRFGLGLPPHKFAEPCYPIHGNSSIISPSSHASYIETCQMPSGYYHGSEHHDSSTGKWRISENIIEKPPCGPLLSNKKQWESVGTIESAPDSGINLEEDHNLPPEARHRILQWMEQGEKVTTQIQQTNYSKNNRTKHPAFNQSHPGLSEQGMQHLRPIVQDPLMPPLPQPDPTNTIEEVSRRLSQKNPREKRSKMHHKNRPGYTSSRSSHVTCPPQFSSDSADCSSSVLSGDYHAAMYSSSSVLSSVPSTVNSNDSGLGAVQKKNKQPVEGMRILYHLPGESVPYQSSLPGKTITLAQFKDLINFKKGNYRYYCYRKTHEKDVEAVFEEIMDNDAALPCFGNKIICKVREA